MMARYVPRKSIMLDGRNFELGKGVQSISFWGHVVGQCEFVASWHDTSYNTLEEAIQDGALVEVTEPTSET